MTAAQEAVMPLSIDYQRHALLYVPRMRLEPAFGAASGPYLDELGGQMRQLIEASAGRAFLLFSSQRALEGVLARLEGALAEPAFVPIGQGRALGRLEMLRSFREEEAAG